MEEKVFFENGDTKVTNSRFVVAGQTYAMAAVNSVKVSATDKSSSNTLPGILIALGSLLLISSLASSDKEAPLLIPIIILAIGIAWFSSIKRGLEYKIILTTSSGEATALTSYNEQDIRSVEKSLNEALIYRG